MRFIEISLNYGVTDADGGPKAEADLRHAVLYMMELGIAVDAFEEDTAGLVAARGDIKTWTPGDPYDPFKREEYFNRRRRLHARAFVYTLSQISGALEQLTEVCPLNEAAAAFQRLDAAFPMLREIRNSLAHAAERARREPDLRTKGADTLKWLGLYGYWQDDLFFITPRAKDVDPHGISVSENSLRIVEAILRELCGLVTKHSLEEHAKTHVRKASVSQP
jgi:hypothetical protein